MKQFTIALLLLVATSAAAQTMEQKAAEYFSTQDQKKNDSIAHSFNLLTSAQNFTQSGNITANDGWHSKSGSMQSFWVTQDTVPVIMLFADTTHYIEKNFKNWPCPDSIIKKYGGMAMCGETIKTDRGPDDMGTAYWINGYMVCRIYQPLKNSAYTIANGRKIYSGQTFENKKTYYDAQWEPIKSGICIFQVIEKQ